MGKKIGKQINPPVFTKGINLLPFDVNFDFNFDLKQECLFYYSKNYYTNLFLWVINKFIAI